MEQQVVPTAPAVKSVVTDVMTEDESGRGSEKVAGCQPSHIADIIAHGQAALPQLEHNHWSDWVDVILSHGALRTQAMEEACTNKPYGPAYRKAIARRLRLYGFDRIDKSDRCRLFECADHFAAIDMWRSSLPTERHLGLNHPRVVLSTWKRSIRISGVSAETVSNSTASFDDQARQFIAQLNADQLLALIGEPIRIELEDRVLKHISAKASAKSKIAVVLTKQLLRALSTSMTMKRSPPSTPSRTKPPPRTCAW